MFFAVLCIAALPVAAFARTTVIENTVRTTTNTGGANVSGGQGGDGGSSRNGSRGADGDDGQDGSVTRGTSESRIDITTVIDGEVVEDIHEVHHGETSVRSTRTATTSNARVETSYDIQMGTVEQQTTALPKVPVVPPTAENAQAAKDITSEHNEDSSVAATETHEYPSERTPRVFIGKVVDALSKTIAYVFSLFT